MQNGWIKLHRCLLRNPIVMKDADYLALWTYILLNATHKEYPKLFKGKKIMLQPGQLITGRKVLAAALKISESKVRRILNEFESDQQIDRQRSNKNTLITVLNWDLYQSDDQQVNQQATNKRPTSDQQVTTLQEYKEYKNVKKENTNTSTEADEIDEAFDKIYDIYPKKVGKTKAKARHRQWLKGRKVNGKTVKLTNAQIWRAVSKYVQSKGDSELRFYKDFNVLLGDCLLDYVEDEE